MTDTTPRTPDPADIPPARPRNRRLVAVVTGGVLLFAAGAGTGAVVTGAVQPAAASTSQQGPGGFGMQGGPGGAQSGTTEGGTQGQMGTPPDGSAQSGQTGTPPDQSGTGQAGASQSGTGSDTQTS